MTMLNRYSNMQTSQVEGINEDIEARATSQSSTALINQFTQAKTSKLYQTEYNRIRNHVSNTLIPHQTVDAAKKRKKELDK